jgi:hypothetical protein
MCCSLCDVVVVNLGVDDRRRWHCSVLERELSLIEYNVARYDDTAGSEVEAVIPTMVRGIAEEDARCGSGAELVGCRGSSVREAEAAEHPEIIITRVDGVHSYQTSYGFASGQIPRRSQGTLLPSSGQPKVSNPWNNVQHKDSI